MTGHRTEAPLRALELLRQRGVAVDDDATDPVKRAAGIAVTRAALRRVRVRHSGRFGWRVGTAAALALVAGAGSWLYASGPGLVGGAAAGTHAAATLQPESQLIVTAGVVVSTRNGRGQAAAAPARLPLLPGDALRTASDGRARLELPRGVRVDVGAATKAWVVDATAVEQSIRLDLGEVHVDVPESGGPKRVAISTPDSQVVVHGTRFRVGVTQDAAGEPPTTKVEVSRGAVLVVHANEERLIRAGGDWASRSKPPVSEGAGSQPDVRTPEARPPSAPRATRKRTAQPSALAAQNRLFKAALTARDVGDDRLAVEHLDTLLKRYPSTPLDREAQLARAEALKRLRSDHSD